MHQTLSQPSTAGFRPWQWLRGQLPGQCAACQQWCHAAVCESCMLRFAAPIRRCHRCATRAGSASTAPCGRCLRRPPPFEATVAGVDYDFPWAGLLGRFKFHAALALSDTWVQLMLAARPSGGVSPELLVPVPLSAARLRARGYNQALILARRLAPALQTQVLENGLVKSHDTPEQASLSGAARWRNLEGAFAVPHPAAVAGLHVGLVDDVMTTGATATQASHALLKAGALSVQVWVAARTA